MEDRTTNDSMEDRTTFDPKYNEIVTRNEDGDILSVIQLDVVTDADADDEVIGIDVTIAQYDEYGDVPPGPTTYFLTLTELQLFANGCVAAIQAVDPSVLDTSFAEKPEEVRETNTPRAATGNQTDHRVDEGFGHIHTISEHDRRAMMEESIDSILDDEDLAALDTAIDEAIQEAYDEEALNEDVDRAIKAWQDTFDDEDAPDADLDHVKALLDAIDGMIEETDDNDFERLEHINVLLDGVDGLLAAMEYEVDENEPVIYPGGMGGRMPNSPAVHPEAEIDDRLRPSGMFIIDEAFYTQPALMPSFWADKATLNSLGLEHAMKTAPDGTFTRDAPRPGMPAYVFGPFRPEVDSAMIEDAYREMISTWDSDALTEVLYIGEDWQAEIADERLEWINNKLAVIEEDHSKILDQLDYDAVGTVKLVRAVDTVKAEAFYAKTDLERELANFRVADLSYELREFVRVRLSRMPSEAELNAKMRKAERDYAIHGDDHGVRADVHTKRLIRSYLQAIHDSYEVK